MFEQSVHLLLINKQIDLMFIDVSPQSNLFDHHIVMICNHQ